MMFWMAYGSASGGLVRQRVSLYAWVAIIIPPNRGLIAAIARIELEMSSLDKQRQALKMAVEILRRRSGATPE